MSVCSGIAVANIYYAQPLLHALGNAFAIHATVATLITTLTQLGYAIGLVLIVPLGDRLDRRRLIPGVALACSFSLAVAAAAPGAEWFIGASLGVGIGATCTQLMVPLAAHLAAPEQRGAVVGRVMAGLLIGILLARAFAGIVADHLGWRAVFGLAALAMLAMAIVLGRYLPAVATPAAGMGYAQTLTSVGRLIIDLPVLRRRIVYGSCGFAGFTMIWTGLSFLLANPPYHYTKTVIGLFSLLGAAGSLGAGFAGRLFDRGWTRSATRGFMLSAITAFALMAGLWRTVGVIIIGLLLMDFGVQGVQILNQSTIYTLAPEARSRITTAYMTCFFLAGAAGSALTGTLIQTYGWPGLTVTAALLELAALGFALTERAA